MAENIKIRKIRKDIKTLDKSISVSEKIKKSDGQAGDDTECKQEYEEPVTYAQGKVEEGIEQVARKGTHCAEEQGHTLSRKVRECLRISQEVGQKKPDVQRKVDSTPPGEGSSVPPAGGKSIYQPKEKNNTHSKMGKKAEAQRTGQSIKSKGKTVKHSGRTVKSAQQAVKTTRKAQQSVKNTSKAAVESARTAKKAAKGAVRAVRSVTAAMKSLITFLIAGGWIVVLILLIVLLFGGFLCMTGGDNFSTISPVSAEVQAYEPVIRKYAKQYGIAEYVELIKAVIMQESGGKGKDPMQSSEGNFNTKYPKQPNGISDPEYSIECGIQELRNCLTSAAANSPMDIDSIKLSLQGYNYGNGYITWALNHYGGYTLANAAEFSDKLALEKGWESYGDKQYVPHVLRYYPMGRIPDGTGNQAVVQIALAQQGNSGETYWRWYGFQNRVSWCACFVSWCADQCGYLQSGVIPKFSLCSDGVKWFQNKGQFKDGSYVPAPGDIIFFDWKNDGTIDHVGIVVRVKKGIVNTIEGNSGDSVKQRSYPVGDDQIYGYGVY